MVHRFELSLAQQLISRPIRAEFSVQLRDLAPCSEVGRQYVLPASQSTFKMDEDLSTDPYILVQHIQPKFSEKADCP